MFSSSDVFHDVAAGRVGGCEFKPVRVGLLGFFGFDQFTDVATGELMVEFNEFAVDFGADDVVAQMGVEMVGEIDRGGALG